MCQLGAISHMPKFTTPCSHTAPDAKKATTSATQLAFRRPKPTLPEPCHHFKPPSFNLEPTKLTSLINSPNLQRHSQSNLPPPSSTTNSKSRPISQRTQFVKHSASLPSEPVTITMHPEDAAHVPGMANVEVKENPMFSRGFAEAVVGTSWSKSTSLAHQPGARSLEHRTNSTAPAPASATAETPKETGGENGAPKTTARKTKSASRTSTTRSRKTAAAKTGTSTAAKRRTTASTTAKKPARATKKDTNAA